MILQSVWKKCVDFLGVKSFVVQPVNAALTNDAGLLPTRLYAHTVACTLLARAG